MITVLYAVLFVAAICGIGYVFMNNDFLEPTAKRASKNLLWMIVGLAGGFFLRKYLLTSLAYPHRFYLTVTIIYGIACIVFSFATSSFMLGDLRLRFKSIFSYFYIILGLCALASGFYLVMQTSIPVEQLKDALGPVLIAALVLFVASGFVALIKMFLMWLKRRG